MQAPVGIIGASGYSGMEATRLLVQHPGVSLRFASSDRWAGQPLEARIPGLGLGSLRYVSVEEGLVQAGDCAVVVMATPAESSLALAPPLLQRGIRIIDLSGAFRLKDPALYPRFYGFSHTAPQLLQEAVYGLPELQRRHIAQARLVANPGCYATAAGLALTPLLRAGLLQPGALITDAASGVSGAGRKASEELSFCEVADDFRAYRTLRHQHTPEIQQTLGLAEAGLPLRPLTFTPHLLPVRRGILATSYGRLRPGATAADISSALEEFARREPLFVAASSADAVALRDVVGTALLRVGAAVDPLDTGLDPGRVVVTSALDNLLKGAASQAVQNLNLLLGLPETTGLERLRPFTP